MRSETDSANGWAERLRLVNAAALDSVDVLSGLDNLRQASPADLVRMTEIYNQAVPERSATADTELRTPDERRAWFDRSDWAQGCPLVVIEQQGQVVGFAGAAPFRPGKRGYDGCLEVSLYVDRAWRSRGVGRQLGHGVVHAARALNNRVLMALVFADNSKSNGLFAHLGFNLCAHLPQAVVFPEAPDRPRDVGIWMMSL